MVPTPAAPRLSRSLPQVYAAAAVRLLMPLTVLPLVASRVGPEAFGRLGFILVWSSLLSVVVEGGFLAAATRLAVQADAAGRWRLAQQVCTARCALSLPLLPLALLAVWIAGSADAQRWSEALAIAALACALGWPATWYLQATQQLHRWARVELLVYAALIAACWAFAYDVATYVALQLAASVLLAWLGWRWLRRDLMQTAPEGGGLLARAELGAGLRLGWTMMPVSLAGAVYSYALPAVASLQMARAELGLYFMADRIVRAALSAADPVFSLTYPRLVRRFEAGPLAALRYAARWAAGGALAGLAMIAAGALLWPLAAGLLARHAGNIDLARLHGVLAVLAWLVPLLLGWKFFGYWMLGSTRYDRAYRACFIVGGIAGVAGAALAGGAGAVALAAVALAVEVLVIVVAVVGVRLAGPLRAAAG